MKLKVMTTDALNFCKKNINDKNLINHYKNNDNPEIWIAKELGKPAFCETDFDIELPTLLIDNANPAQTELENIKLLYTALADLNSCVTFDERFWAGLCHTFYYDFVRKSVLKKNQFNAKTIFENFFFETPRSKIKDGTIPRLWVIGKTYIRKDKVNPFEYLELMVNSDWTIQTLRMHTINAFHNPLAVDAFMECEIEINKKYSKRFNRDMVMKLTQYTNTFFKNNEIIDDSMKKVLCNKLIKKAEELLKKEEKEKEDVLEKQCIEIFQQLGGYASIEAIENKINSTRFKNSQEKENISNFINSERKIINSKYINKIKINDIEYFLLNNQYLSEELKENKNKFINENFYKMSEDAQGLHHLISALNNQTFSIENLQSFEAPYQLIKGKEFNFSKMINKGLKEFWYFN